MIRPAEQLRVLADVVRRYPKIQVLEIPCERGNGHVIFPVYGATGGPAALMVVLFTGSLPDKPTGDFGSSTNDFRLCAWKTGKAATVSWAFGLDGDALYNLIDAAAQALVSA